ncbi:MAG: argininosuccinate lyase [Candidatus Sericytochromatia bacterium]|nr:argininosuccinate lyase [Candidatus Sericytochromatia bacterium]
MPQGATLWGGRFEEAPDPTFSQFNQSWGVDRRLLHADVLGSMAHCRGLAGAGVLSAVEAATILDGLRQIQEAATPEGLAASAAEDVHAYIEATLHGLIGDLAFKLHTGRSRNDQVATALRLWLREEVAGVIALVRRVQAALLDLAERHPDAVLPGYTHLQRAQPILWAHWCLAHFEALSRDVARLEEVYGRTNVMPLGAAALAGTGFPIDREAVARDLGFAAPCRNSLDAVGDRDFCVEFASAASLVMVHLSRLAEDLVIFASREFGFISLADAVAAGSSLMPQKKNPDALELVRGKAGRVFGHLTALLTMLKGLPMAYNKDLQEDKQAVFDTVDTLRGSLAVTATVLDHTRLREDVAAQAAGRGALNATELADHLVRQGVPFRQAHALVGKLVLQAEQLDVELHDMPLEALQAVCPAIDEEVRAALSMARTLASKGQLGGTAPRRVQEALRQARAALPA